MAKQRHCRTCGEPLTGKGWHVYCLDSDTCRPYCAFDGCAKPVRGGSNWCDAHYRQQRKTGTLKPLRWTDEWMCVVCGTEVPKGTGRRKHCSSRCQALESRSPDRPKSFDCVRCGETVSLITPSTKTGQFKRADASMCDRCKHHQQRRYGMSVAELARRDGTKCRICGDEVNMSADKTDLFRPSVDHIMPRSAGGTDDSTNLQLAHLWCNQVKHKSLVTFWAVGFHG